MPWLFSIAFIFTALFSAAAMKNAELLAIENSAGEAKAISANMLVYGNYVKAYAVANPSVIGTVPDSSLALPVWFVKAPSIQNYVDAGKGYAYVQNPPVGLVYQLSADTQHSRSVGVNMSGQLVSPVGGATGTAVPPAIPDRSVVYGD